VILLIDNYDSFSYNLYQMLGAERDSLKVIRNDEMTVEDIRKIKPEAIVLSPGPGRPENAGICVEAVEKLAGKIPILGVCLGHQSICQAFGGKITYAERLMHGKTSEAQLDGKSKLFEGMRENILIGRYHSLTAEEESLPTVLKITARTKEGEIMAVEHREYPIYGLQFHPESILTPDGAKIIHNFMM
jgi:anthranilate synthase component 2